MTDIEQDSSIPGGWAEVAVTGSCHKALSGPAAIVRVDRFALTRFRPCRSIAAQSSGVFPLTLATSDLGPIFFWSLLLIGLLIAGFFVVVLVKRRLAKADDGPQIGFSLSDLRQMRQQGQLTEEEYERARAKMVASLKAMAAKKETGIRETRESRQTSRKDEPEQPSAED